MSVPTIEREDGGPDQYRCDDCGTVYPFDSLNPIQSYHERVEAGGEVPAGECPDEECGALCYPVALPQAAPATQAEWCERLVDAYNTLVSGDVFFDPQSDDENARLENATELIEGLVGDAQAYLAQAGKAEPEARLADVVGTVSIDGGIATLPDGSTVNLRPAPPAAGGGSLYRLSCFFRDLPVAGDVAMDAGLRVKLAALTADEREQLGAAALALGSICLTA